MSHYVYCEQHGINYDPLHYDGCPLCGLSNIMDQAKDTWDYRRPQTHFAGSAGYSATVRFYIDQAADITEPKGDSSSGVKVGIK